MVDTSNSGSGVIALGLKARDEGSNWGWKRFRNDATLSVTYNDVPNAPVGLKTSLTTCFTSPDINAPGIPVFSMNSQTLAATANDPNGDNLHEYFEVWNWHGSYIRTLDTGTRAPGVQFSAQTGALPDGT